MVAKLSFYEQVGILIPGGLFLAAALSIVPGASAFLSPRDVTIGEFGIFMIVAYASGHAVAALGNILESAWWYLRRGMPTDWVVQNDDRILSTEQKRVLLENINSAFGTNLLQIVGINRSQWTPIGRQIYRYSLTINPTRIDVFNGNYGLNRGLAAALFSLAILNEFVAPQYGYLSLALGIVGLIFLYRMNRFAINFAREVYLVFLNAKAPSPASPAARPVT